MDAVLHEIEQSARFLTSEGGPSLLALVVLSLFVVPLVVWVHELGHALVAMRLLDAEVELTVGSVGKVLEAQWGSLQVRVNALGGQGQVSLDGARATARDMLLISLAGPAASACGLVVTAVALAWVPPGLVHDAIWVAMLFSVAATLSVVPLAVSRAAPGRPEVRSDGQLALAAARVLWQLR